MVTTFAQTVEKVSTWNKLALNLYPRIKTIFTSVGKFSSQLNGKIIGSSNIFVAVLYYKLMQVREGLCRGLH